MKIASPIFSVLLALILMFSMAIFIAGTLIFLVIQAFYELYISSGILAAYFWVLIALALLAVLFFAIMRIWFCSICKQKSQELKIKLLKRGILSRFFVSFLLYRTVKSFFKGKK